jgi:hypothetical protein
MYDYLTVSDAANELEQRLGLVVPPRVVGDVLYQRALPIDRCPIRSGRRLIPLDLLDAIEAILRERGRFRTGAEEVAE